MCSEICVLPPPLYLHRKGTCLQQTHKRRHCLCLRRWLATCQSLKQPSSAERPPPFYALSLYGFSFLGSNVSCLNALWIHITVYKLKQGTTNEEIQQCVTSESPLALGCFHKWLWWITGSTLQQFLFEESYIMFNAPDSKASKPLPSHHSLGV